MSLFYLEHPAETDLALFAGGEMGPLARWRIERHVQACDHCRDLVADFFHLQGDLAELAEVPSMDWNALAQSITERFAREASQKPLAPGLFSRPAVLRAGFAAASVLCVLVVVRQFHFETRTEPVSKPLVAKTSLSPAESTAAAEEDAAQSNDRVASAPVEPPGSQAGIEAQSSENRRMRQTELEVAAPADSSGGKREIGATVASPGGEALPTDVPRPAAPPDPRKTDLAAGPRALGFADESEAFRAGEDRAPTAGPAAESEARTEQQLAANADLSGVAPETQTQVLALSEETELARGAGQQVLRDQAGETRPLAERMRAAEDRRAGTAALAGQPGFGIQPAALDDPQVDVGVAADGWMSVRSVDSKTGTITITHVYVP